MLTQGQGAGLGVATRVEHSPYKGGGMRNDLVPLYLYEGDHVFLHAWRVGLKYDASPGLRFSTFFNHRFEGFPYDHTPGSLAGMAGRDPGFDFGVGFRDRVGEGYVYGEALHDISGVSRGGEFKLGYYFDFRSGGLQLRPTISASYRDGKLNNYYYGVEPGEATATRPAYHAGAGLNGQIGLNLRYDLTQRWRLVGAVNLTRWADTVRNSPITDVPLAQSSAFLGFAYDFTPEQPEWHEPSPLIWKVMYGRSTDCNLVPSMRLTCTSIDTVDKTSITSLEIGKPLMENVNGWPLDFAGYVGLLRHNEQGLQPDSWQVDAYVKAFYYGFPWRDRVRTRIGFGVGVSYAQRVPYVEERDQAARGRNTSKLLNYLDPSIDVNLGDLFGKRSWRETYFGFGASHRSGIFGNSQMLGNVNGGSNYIYTFVEWKM